MFSSHLCWVCMRVVRKLYESSLSVRLIQIKLIRMLILSIHIKLIRKRLADQEYFSLFSLSVGCTSNNAGCTQHQPNLDYSVLCGSFMHPQKHWLFLGNCCWTRIWKRVSLRKRNIKHACRLLLFFCHLCGKIQNLENLFFSCNFSFIVRANVYKREGIQVFPYNTRQRFWQHVGNIVGSKRKNIQREVWMQLSG